MANRSVPDLGIEYDLWGEYPVQALGTIRGREFHFRAKHGEWEFEVADAGGVLPSDGGKAEFVRRGKHPDASHMPHEEAASLIESFLREYAAAVAAGAGPTDSYPCPCCGYEVFSEPAGSFEICPICFWEDDIVQLAFPDLGGGANKCSLIDAQRNYERLGACEERLAPHVRPVQSTDRRSPGWRPIDPTRDPYLGWGNRADHELWNSVKNESPRCDYYWLPDYWLANRQK